MEPARQRTLAFKIGPRGGKACEDDLRRLFRQRRIAQTAPGDGIN